MGKIANVFNWGGVGVLVGVFSGIIAFLVTYTLLMKQLNDQEREITKKVDEFRRLNNDFTQLVEHVDFAKEIPVIKEQFDSLTSQIKLIGETELYLRKEVENPKSSKEVQEIYKFLAEKGARSKTEKEKMFSLAMSPVDPKIRTEAAKAFALSMSQEDWGYMTELLLNPDFYVVPLIKFSKDAFPANEKARAKTLLMVKNRLDQAYINEEPDPWGTVKETVFIFNLNNIWQEKEYLELINFVENKDDPKTLSELNEALAKARN